MTLGLLTRGYLCDGFVRPPEPTPTPTPGTPPSIRVFEREDFVARVRIPREGAAVPPSSSTGPPPESGASVTVRPREPDAVVKVSVPGEAAPTSPSDSPSPAESPDKPQVKIKSGTKPTITVKK